MTKTYVMTGLIEKVRKAVLGLLVAGILTMDVYRRCNRPTRISGMSYKEHCIQVRRVEQRWFELHRYMGLNDLLLEIKQDQNNFLGDESMENKVLRQVLSLVEDKISEVKNQAVKW